VQKNEMESFNSAVDSAANRV